MKQSKKGLSRREFVTASAATALAGLMSKELWAQAKAGPEPAKKSATRLILLGNGGGPRPNKLYNQSAWVVVVDSIPYVVDCGGGVSRQLVMADIPLKSLRYIFLTHHHSDHNLEYGSLMYNAWVSGFKGRIDTYGPPPLARITELFLEMNAYDITIRIPDEGRSPLKPMIVPHEFSQGGLVLENDRVKVTAALVNHPPVVPAFAYRFDTADRSIVFSGDTTPCDSLIRLAKGADILVHEVIHKPSLARLFSRIPNADRLLEHIVASHTTHEDVGKVARDAGVKTLVLTHYVPVDDPSLTDDHWTEEARKYFKGKIVAGKDLMEL
ncbi:MAG: MBL fold metallo-hydrolase [Desulfobacca sp.]|nr:MBL fold metallo-hydrolase [Desulfobacca sp.]